ncbi:MAG: hypothetical protein A2Y76_00755 [Planctomycetes bacterium RBG_13_60_9]|nr:MAG: hypothetical protein A2Y76_00755 [Planctomycetes bacterium RBG_13_60_9]
MELRDILDITRRAIREYAGQDPDKWFYANRFVFARLQLDERRTKVQIKKELLDTQPTCACEGCPLGFDSKRGIHLHRIDSRRGYTRENCVLMHNECHTKYHAEHPVHRQRERPFGGRANPPRPILKKISKRYEGASFLYWWDISPGFLNRMDDYEEMEFVKKDSGERCSVPILAMKGYLTAERRTSRNNGPWGIRVLRDRGGELAFEPGREDDRWLFLPVVWLGDSHED